MNSSIQSVTLQTAVLMQVQAFAKANQEFSIHDITTAVRSKVNNGELEIPEVEVSGASFRFDIPHTKIKDIFNELWNTGVFDPEFTLSRQYTGMYYKFTPTLNTPVPSAPFVSAPPVSATVPSVTYTSPSPAISGDKVSVMERIKKYLNGCKARNFRPSLKQVQSAIKRGDESTGWQCSDLKDIITNDLGLTVVDNPDSVSKAQVVL